MAWLLWIIMCETLLSSSMHHLVPRLLHTSSSVFKEDRRSENLSGNSLRATVGHNRNQDQNHNQNQDQNHIQNHSQNHSQNHNQNQDWSQNWDQNRNQKSLRVKPICSRRFSSMIQIKAYYWPNFKCSFANPVTRNKKTRCNHSLTKLVSCLQSYLKTRWPEEERNAKKWARSRRVTTTN